MGWPIGAVDAVDGGVGPAGSGGDRSVCSGGGGAGAGARQIAVFWLLGLVLAVPAGGLAVRHGFDGLYGQDAYAYFDYGAISVRQSLSTVAPLQPFFWPPGYPLLVALASFAVGPTALA